MRSNSRTPGRKWRSSASERSERVRCDQPRAGKRTIRSHPTCHRRAHAYDTHSGGASSLADLTRARRAWCSRRSSTRTRPSRSSRRRRRTSRSRIRLSPSVRRAESCAAVPNYALHGLTIPATMAPVATVALVVRPYGHTAIRVVMKSIIEIEKESQKNVSVIHQWVVISESK
jgi:hypothetical protein